MTADIAKCFGENRLGKICPYRERCYRYCSPYEAGQKYMAAPEDMTQCADFMDTEPPEAA